MWSCVIKVKQIKARLLKGENRLLSRKYINIKGSLACTLCYLFIITDNILLIVLLIKEISYY
jgi:hypothetical protein